MLLLTALISLAQYFSCGFVRAVVQAVFLLSVVVPCMSRPSTPGLVLAGNSTRPILTTSALGSYRYRFARCQCCLHGASFLLTYPALWKQHHHCSSADLSIKVMAATPRPVRPVASFLLCFSTSRLCLTRPTHLKPANLRGVYPSSSPSSFPTITVIGPAASLTTPRRTYPLLGKPVLFLWLKSASCYLKLENGCGRKLGGKTH